MAIDNLGSIFLGAVFTLTVLGMDTIYPMTYSISSGQVIDINPIIGICCGIFVHASIAAFGLSTIISNSMLFYLIIRYVGAGYIIYLGIQALIQKNTIYYEAPETQGKERTFRWKTSGTAILKNVLNPKPVLFFFAFLSQFIKPPHNDIFILFLLLAGLFLLMVITWYILSNFYWNGNNH